MPTDPASLEKQLSALGLDQSPEEFVASLPEPVKKRVEALSALQKQKDEIEEQYRKERAELEAKYEKLYAPLYEQRSGIVTGATEIAGADNKGIPEFWLTAFLKCDMTREVIQEKDIDVLKHLKDITCETVTKDGAPAGFRLKFFFSENPYFTNEVLEKTYHMMPDEDSVLEKSEGTKINWNAGKDVTVKIMKKKKKGGKIDAKPQIKTEKCESFFNFFDPPEVPNEGDSMEEEMMEELQDQIEMDYELGEIIRERIIPDALDWFTGEAAEEDEGGMVFDGLDEDEEGPGFGGDDDDEDDDDDEEGGNGAAKGGKEQPPECKQQ
jgi:nucleosome assembly protein 1-like 1